MNFKNLSENLIIVIVSVAVGGFVGYYASKESNKQTIKLLTPTLTTAIKKETTAIKNEIDLQVDKIKKSDSINININQKPTNGIQQSNKSAKCVPNGFTLIRIKNLTRRQKRRLNID